MNKPKVVVTTKPTPTFHVRKLTKSGSSRYLSIGTIIPIDWTAVKMTVEKLEGGICILKLEQIK